MSMPTPSSPTPREADTRKEAKQFATLAEARAHALQDPASEWDQVGNCSCLDQVKAAPPRVPHER